MKKLFVIRKTMVAALLMGVLVAGTSVQGETSKVSSLKFEQDKSGSSDFIITKSGAIDVQDFTMDDPPRLVLDFVGALHELPETEFDGDGTFVQRVRTSQFTNEPDMVTRVVFDLKHKAKYKVLREDQSVTVRFYSSKEASERARSAMPSMESTVDPMDFASALVQPMEGLAGDAGEQPEPKQASPEQATPVVARAATPEKTTAKPETQATKTEPEAEMRTSWEKPSPVTQQPTPPTVLPGTQDFQSYAASTGLVKNRNITIDVQEADIQTVIRSLSEFSNTNIIAGPEVEGKVTAHLTNVPWRQAMAVILKSHGFGYREEYGVIRVSTIEKLTKEELELEAAARQKDELLPLETRIINISFSNASELKEALEEMLSQRGSMEVERGNNALIVTDIAKNIDKIATMVTELDKKIKQVEIVAKLVDLDFEATREIGVRWNFLNLAHQDINTVGDFRISAPSASPTGQLRVGTVQSWGEVQAIIDMLERENKADIISNPRIVTADNREASILVGKEIPLIVSDEAGNPITELTKIGIILRVTPHVNSDNTIALDLHPEVSDLSAQATVQGGVVIVLSEADTRVVVGDGETAVIGGLISEVTSKLENGVPLLKDIPFLGGLFRLSSDTTKKRELVIFVTPKIVES